MKSKNLIILSVIIIIITTSCQKNDNDLKIRTIDQQTPNSLNDKYFIENNIVCFKDLESFNKVVSELHNYNGDSLIKWEIKNNFLYSYRRIMDAELQNDADPNHAKFDKLIIEDPVFATLVNQDGVIRIGNFLYKMTYDHVFKIPINSFEKGYFSDIGLDDIRNSERVEVFDIDRKVFSSKNKSVSGKNSVFKPHPLDPNLKAELEGWCVNYLFYGSIGIRITGWKNDGGWRTDRMVYAKVDGCAWGGPSWSPPVEYCDSNYGYDEKKVAKTLLWYSGIVYCDSIRCTYSYKDGGYQYLYQWIEIWD